MCKPPRPGTKAGAGGVKEGGGGGWHGWLGKGAWPSSARRHRFGSDSLLCRVQNLSLKVSRPARSPPLRRPLHNSIRRAVIGGCRPTTASTLWTGQSRNIDVAAEMTLTVESHLKGRERGFYLPVKTVQSSFPFESKGCR